MLLLIQILGFVESSILYQMRLFGIFYMIVNIKKKLEWMNTKAKKPFTPALEMFKQKAEQWLSDLS